MLFNKTILALFFLGMTHVAYSQEEDNIKHSAYFRYAAIDNFQFADWDTYIEKYNTENNPVEKLGDFKQTFNFDIGYRFEYNKIYSSLSYQHYHGVASASYLYGEKRQFDVTANSVSWGFGYNLINPDKKFYLAPFINIRFGDKVRVLSSAIYPDGFHSVGSDKPLNGTFLGSGLLGEELGVLLKYKVNSKFAVEVDASKMWANLVAPASLDDGSVYKAFSGGGGISSLEITETMSAVRLMVGLSYTFSDIQNSTWWQ
ncbi:MAG: hypothetical protein NT150_07840 [Bacteroidetes bacterium]|nr:hypothetical protein [Bacteroidota bacterium]